MICVTLTLRFFLHISICERNHSLLWIDDGFITTQHAHARYVLLFDHIFIAYFQYENLNFQFLNELGLLPNLVHFLHHLINLQPLIYHFSFKLTLFPFLKLNSSFINSLIQAFHNYLNKQNSLLISNLINHLCST